MANSEKHEDHLDELVGKRLAESYDKLPPELKTPPADVSGGPVGDPIETLPQKLLGVVDAAIWEHNKLYNLLCLELPEFQERLFPLHLSLNRDGSWHVEEGERCKTPFDSNYSFYIKPTVSRDVCREAAREALNLCVSYLIGPGIERSLAQRIKNVFKWRRNP